MPKPVHKTSHGKENTAKAHAALLKANRLIGIVGTRQRDKEPDYRKCLEVFSKVYRAGDYIVSGGCDTGGDRFAELIAKEQGIPILIYHANWFKNGKGAGFIRNTDIAEACDVLIAVMGEDSKGTEDTVRKALKLKKKVVYVN